MELWGGDDSAEESALLDELEDILDRLMTYGHKKEVKVTGFVLTMIGTSEEYDGQLHTSTNMRGQTIGEGRRMVDLMEERMKRLEVGEPV